MAKFLSSVLLLIAFAGTAAGAQAPCHPGTDPFAARRADLAAGLAAVTAADLSALAASNQPDKMVLLGDYYAKSGQMTEAQQWWNEAAQRGDPLGFVALGDHTGEDLSAKRKYYAQAAQLDDPGAELVYGEMLLQGEGGPAAKLLGREYVLKAAREGGVEAMAVAGAASTGLPGQAYTDVFPKLPPLADCYLNAAQAHGSVQARRVLRQAYDAGVLTDPVPTPMLSQTSAFLDYLKSFAPAERPGVLQQAIDKDRGSPNTTRALEEIAWLSPPPTPGAPVSPTVDILRAQSPNNVTALYFTLLAALPSVPIDPFSGKPVLHDQTAFAVGSRLAEAAKAGLAGLDSPTLTLGLDADAMQVRRVSAMNVFQQAAALNDAVASGARWLKPKTADDVIDDYLDQRGGLAGLAQIGVAHLTVGVSLAVQDKDPKTWQREEYVARQEVYPWQPHSGDNDDFSPPDLDSRTHEFVVSNGHGWYLKNDNGPTAWTPDVPPQKRGKAIPPDFGVLHAPAAGDLDGPLVEYARLRPEHPAVPQVSLLPGLVEINGVSAYHLNFAYGNQGNSDGSGIPDYDAYVDAKTYQLVQLTWSWPGDKAVQQVDYSQFQRLPGGFGYPAVCVFTLRKDANSDNDIVETDTVTRLALNPTPLDGGIFSMTKDDVKKIKDLLQQHADDDKKNN